MMQRSPFWQLQSCSLIDLSLPCCSLHGAKMLAQYSQACHNDTYMRGLGFYTQRCTGACCNHQQSSAKVAALLSQCMLFRSFGQTSANMPELHFAGSVKLFSICFHTKLCSTGM